MTEARDIGKRIKQLHELRNFSQQYMADNLGITQQNYSKMEKDEIDFPISRLYTIAETLGVEVSTLFNFDASPIFNTHQHDFKDHAVAIGVQYAPNPNSDIVLMLHNIQKKLGII